MSELPTTQEVAENAWAQAMAAQTVLLGLIHTLRGNMLSDEILNKAFDIAAETYVAGSYSTNKFASAHATRTLQAVEDMRRSIIEN